jgi:hypothetical protein
MGLRGYSIEIYVKLKSQESHPIYGVLLLVQNPGDLLYLWHRDTHLQHKHKTLESSEATDACRTCNKNYLSKSPLHGTKGQSLHDAEVFIWPAQKTIELRLYRSGPPLGRSAVVGKADVLAKSCLVFTPQLTPQCNDIHVAFG